MFLQVIVRLASPISMDLVLRKRISVKVYKRQSWKDSLLKKITRVSTFILFATPETLRGMGTSFLREDFLGSFGWTSVSYDWSMVFKANINQSEVTLVHLHGPRNRFADSLYA